MEGRPGLLEARDLRDRDLRPLRALGGLQVALGDDRLDVAVRRRRHDDAQHLGHPAGVRRARDDRRAGAHPPAPRRGVVHREGGDRGVRPGRDHRLRHRGRARPLAPARAGPPAVHRRLADGADPRDRADGRDRPRLEGRRRMEGGRDPRRVPHLLPGRDQRAARPAVRRPARVRVDGVVRVQPLERPLAACVSRPRCPTSSPR